MGSLKTDPVHGLDGYQSWITAALCSWVLFLAMSTISSSGVLYYGIIDTFGITREEASWPVTLPDSLLNLAGPLMGALCRWFSCRTVMLFCCFFTGLGISICFFSRGVLFLSLMFGALHGLTLAGIFVSVNAILAQHFDKRRNTAFSMLNAVTGLNGLVLPPLVQFFYSTYGSRGAFLLLGAILFNGFPAAISIRSPPWVTQTKKLNFSFLGKAFHQSSKVRPATKPRYLTHVKAEGANYRFKNVHKAIKPKDPVIFMGKDDTNENTTSHNLARTQGDKLSTTERKTINISSWKTTARQFLTMSFFIDSLTIAAVIICTTTFVLVYVDLAADRGITASKVLYIQYVFFLGDISCRALVGFIIDRNILSLEVAMLAGFLVQAIAYEILAWAAALPTMMIGSLLIGMSSGFRIPLQAPILIEDFGVDLLPVMMGGANFFLGVMNVARPTLIGYCRDQLGKYDMLLHIVAVVNFALACVWIPRLLVRRRERARKAKSTINEEQISIEGGQLLVEVPHFRINGDS